mmetsp:Transcript_33587/g.78575  ORF Transcript_33587/g.78575 Transcript_33587/m.78575 type:complete len:295 (-) Transcript_33587:44-928(-)
MRREEQLVAGLDVRALPVVLHQRAYPRALGMPEHQAAARGRLNGEEAQVLADTAVVAAHCLRPEALVLLELRGRLPRSAVDALQHRPPLVSPPVGTCDRFECDGILWELARVVHVRARTQVPPAVANVVNRDRLLQSLENLQLVRLVRLTDSACGFVAAHLLAHERQLHLDDLVHLLLDAPQVFLLERLGRVEIVVESVLDPRPDTHLCAFEELLHRHGQDVRAGMSDTEQASLIVLVGWQRFVLQCDGAPSVCPGLVRMLGGGRPCASSTADNRRCARAAPQQRAQLKTVREA